MPSVVKYEGPDDARRKKVLVALGRALDEFQKLNPTMPVAQVQAFLLTAISDELSMSEIADRTGMKISTTSRYLIDLAEPRHEEDTAYGLIERSVDPREPRRARYPLSRKGKALVNRLISTLFAICEECKGDDLSGKGRR